MAVARGRLGVYKFPPGRAVAASGTPPGTGHNGTTAETERERERERKRMNNKKDSQSLLSSFIVVARPCLGDQGKAETGAEDHTDHGVQKGS